MANVKKQAEEFAANHLAELAQQVIQWQDTGLLPCGRMQELAAIWAQVDAASAMSLAEGTATRAALNAAAAKQKGKEIARNLKVFNGLMSGRGKPQVRTIVAASSQKQAAAILGITLSEVREFWSCTSNEVALATALATPGTVFQASTSFANDFLPKA